MVFPQGSGALLTVKNLPDNGTVCLVDIGMKTTDCVVARIEEGIMIPVASLCISVELGVKDFYDSVAGYYENKTGSSPGFLRILEVVERGGKVTYERKPIDLSTEIELSRNEIKEAIVDRVKNSLAEIWSELDRVYVSGGGSIVFDSIAGQMGAERIDEPVWANAAGFLKAGISSEK
jgi:plasmid segregation protein ParM